MKITNWKRFNESVSEKFTEEMAQEIIYCFSESSELDKELEQLRTSFYNSIESEGHENDFIMYETDYNEMKEMIRKLYGLAQTESLTFRDDMIQLYHKIRKIKSKFPHIYEIEDLFLDFIESNNFRLFIDYIKYYGPGEGKIYEVRLWSNGHKYNMDDFNKFCGIVSNTVKSFSYPGCKMFLSECKYNFYEHPNAAGIDFKVKIKTL